MIRQTAGAQHQNAPIDFAGQVHRHTTARGEEQYQRVTAPLRREESPGCAKSRQDQSFREKLFQQPTTSCTDGEPNGHLISACERPHQQQIADVRARDEQDKNNDGKHDFECGKQSACIVEGRLP